MRLFREAGETAEHDGDTDRAAAAYARSVEVGTRMTGSRATPPVSELAPMLSGATSSLTTTTYPPAPGSGSTTPGSPG